MERRARRNADAGDNYKLARSSLSLPRSTFRAHMAFEIHNCLEQSPRQLCFNKRHEKTSRWMPPLSHQCLPSSDVHAGPSTFSNGDDSRLALAHVCTGYRHPRADSHNRIYTNSTSTALYE